MVIPFPLQPEMSATEPVSAPCSAASHWWRDRRSRQDALSGDPEQFYWSWESSLHFLLRCVLVGLSLSTCGIVEYSMSFEHSISLSWTIWTMFWLDSILSVKMHIDWTLLVDVWHSWIHVIWTPPLRVVAQLNTVDNVLVQAYTVCQDVHSLSTLHWHVA